jgi:enoyl-CoA hydratase/carnithine racemase
VEFERILLKRSADFATITMNRPQRGNALPLARMPKLISAFTQVGQSDAVGIVLAGTPALGTWP